MDLFDAVIWFNRELEHAINRFWLISVLIIFDGIVFTYCYIALNKKVIRVIGYATIFLFFGSFTITIIDRYISNDIHSAYIFTIGGTISCVLFYILDGLISGFKVIVVFIGGAVIPLILLELIGLREILVRIEGIGFGLQAAVAISGGIALVVLSLKFGRWLRQYPITHITVSSFCGALILGALIIWYRGGNNVEMLTLYDIDLFGVFKEIDNAGQAIVFLFFWVTGFISQSLIIIKSRGNDSATVSKLFFSDKNRYNYLEKSLNGRP